MANALKAGRRVYELDILSSRPAVMQRDAHSRENFVCVTELQLTKAEERSRTGAVEISGCISSFPGNEG